jgi:hypothetical protein
MNQYLKYGLIALACILLCAWVFKSCSKKKVIKPAIINPAFIRDSVSKKEDIYQKKYDSLVLIVDGQVAKNNYLQTQLLLSKKREQYLASSLRTDIQPTKETVIEYIDNSEHTDSLCDSSIAVLMTELSTKDSMLILKDSLYKQLHQSFNELADQSTFQITYEKDLEKDIRKRKRIGILYKTGVVAAFVLGLLVK